MKDLISKAKIIVTKDNEQITINIKKDLLELLEGAYFTPSYVVAKNDEILRAKDKGVWIEVIMDKVTSFKDYSFSSLLFQLKPKYNFLTFIRKENDTYTGKCINYNLATNTTQLYKIITEEKYEK